MSKQKRYIAMIETHRNGRREQWAEGKDGHSLSSSGRWTDGLLRRTKKEAEEQAKKLAAGFNKTENPQPYVRTVEVESAEKPRAHKTDNSAKKQCTSTPSTPNAETTFTVKEGRTSKTFATKKEAKAYASQSKNKTVNIVEGTKKPTHKIVSFSAKK